MNETAGQDPIYDARNWKRHARQIVSRDGQTRTEKRPIVKSVLMVDMAGSAHWVSLYTGPMQKHEADPYRVSIMVAKLRDGWLLLGECPKNSGSARHLPDDQRVGRACTQGSKGGPVSAADPCKCVIAIMAVRAAENAKRMARLEGKGKTLADAQLEETRKLNAAIVNVLTGAKDKAAK